ncbi:cysteine desulfurase family protein [Gryllotalpicola koreensis]|uniref:Cysteine desulfurase family protein n=1 Tax=Gryllotalpicola koreensis TaxID=993086 RepID=A0ABP7ZVB0_9MICO
MGVYLDHAATTPMLPEAIDAYARAMSEVGNPSSIHSAGQNARRLLEEARETVAASLGCDPIEVVFTSGGTEAINLALKGGFWAATAASPARRRLVVPNGEHHATLDTVEWLVAHEGADVTWVGLDSEGFIETDAWAEALRGDDVALASALWVNNEVGTIEPVAELAAAAASASVPLHLDAVAAYGHVPISFRALGAAALSVSAHKIGGPVGIGALVLSRTARVVPTVHGGGQQRNVRSGTQDVAAAVSFAVAAQAAVASLEAERARLTALRDRLIAGVRAAVPEARLSGPSGNQRVASSAHFTFPGAQGDSLLFLLDAAGVAVSTGSACQAGIPEPSHVVLAMGRETGEASSCLRITLGRTTTDADVDAFLAALPDAYARAAKAGFTAR